MAVDTALKMQDILSDYESALAKFENIDFLYNSHKDKFTITEEDDEQTITRKKARLNELLVDLGRVGELALKYIIKLKQLELYPNQTIDQFRKEALFKKGQLKNLAAKQKVSEEELDELLNYEDINNQPFHNFDYLFSIIEKLMQPQATSFYKIIEYSMLSREIKKEPLSKDERRNFEDVIFPEYTVRPMQDEEEEREVREKIINLRRDTIRDSGDIFTRLRYFSNNPHDKEFDFQSIYDLMKDIIMSIRTIHECNDDVEYDPIEGYAKIMALENPELTYRPANELRDVFNLYKSKTDAYGLLGLLFSAKDYTFEQLKEITSMKQVHPKDYVTIFCNELKKEDIEFFLQYGITNYDQMGAIGSKKSKTPFETFLSAVGIRDRFTFEEMQQVAIDIEADKYDNLELFEYLTVREIQEVNKHPKLLGLLKSDLDILYFLKKMTKLVYMNEDTFIQIMSIPEVAKGDINVIKSLYYQQLSTYRNISEPFLNEPLVSEIVNKENFFDDMIIEHVKENAEFFDRYPEFEGAIPYMLDPDDNKEILHILRCNGLDILAMKNFDGTIFHVPVRLTKLVLDIMNKHNLPLIENNQVSKRYYQLLEIIMRKLTKKNYFGIVPISGHKYSDVGDIEEIVFKKAK